MRKKGGERHDRMESFGKLLRNLRGATSLEAISDRTGLSARYLAKVEAGEVVVDEEAARQIIRSGFGLPVADEEHLILGIQLYDLGLRDNTLRQIIIAIIRKEAPASATRVLCKAYRDLPDGRGRRVSSS